jgi:hypothetical protein
MNNLCWLKIGDQNLFLVANHNGGSPDVNNFFDAFVLIDMTNALGRTLT